MSPNFKRLLYWTPRVLCVLFALFLSMFAFDVFGVGNTFWESVGAFLIHLIPMYIVVIVLLLSWRWEWIGAALFAGLAIFYVVATGLRQHWSAYVIISGWLLLLSGLFLLNWMFREELRAR